MQHLVVSHTYGVCDVPPGSNPAEQRKKMDSDPDSSSATMVEKPQTPSASSKQWEPHKGRERGRERSLKGDGMWRRGALLHYI